MSASDSMERKEASWGEILGALALVAGAVGLSEWDRHRRSQKIYEDVSYVFNQPDSDALRSMEGYIYGYDLLDCDLFENALKKIRDDSDYANQLRSRARMFLGHVQQLRQRFDKTRST